MTALKHLARGLVYALAMGLVWLFMSLGMSGDGLLAPLGWYFAASLSGQLFVLAGRI